MLAFGMLGKLPDMRQAMRVQGSIKLNHTLRLIWSALLLCIVVPLLTACQSQKTIVNGLDEREANEILVYLASQGIGATKVPGKEAGGGGGAKVQMWDITVNTEQATTAMALLNQAGLPRKKSQSLLGIFSGTGLVPSEMEQKIRYQAGLGEQIASIIRKIDGILDAEVQISFPEEDPLTGKTKGKITASVYVKHNGVLDDPNSHLVTKLKRLVAAAITGLDYDNVTVISDRARAGESPSFGLTSAEEDKQYVSIWTIAIAKESATRFRIIFFSFTITILILLLMLIWMGWKIYPVLEKSGGFKQLLRMHPIDSLQKGAAKEKPAKEEEKKPASSGEKESADKEVDDT